MSKIAVNPEIELKLTMALDEEEVRALEAMTGYGVDKFIEVFYEKLGENYMKKHEVGLRSFLNSIREQVPPYIDKVNKARLVFEKKN